MRRLAQLLLAVCVFAAPSPASAGDHYVRWQQNHPYHNPYLYPGRAVYAGSRYGFYGYARPYTGLNQPVPFSMKRTAPRTFAPPLPDFGYAQPERFIEGGAVPIHD